MLQELGSGRSHRRVQVQHGFDDARERRTISLWEGRYTTISNENTKLCVGLCFVEWGFQCAELKDEATKGPNVGLGVVRFFLHEFGGHVIWRLKSSITFMRGGKGRTPT